MSMQFHQERDGKLLVVEFSGILRKEDYRQTMPAIEQSMPQGEKARMLLDMHDFHGWTLPAALEDFKFGIKHFNHIQRLAVCGENSWEKWMATLAKPFTTATVRYFPREEMDDAKNWVASD